LVQRIFVLFKLSCFGFAEFVTFAQDIGAGRVSGKVERVQQYQRLSSVASCQNVRKGAKGLKSSNSPDPRKTAKLHVSDAFLFSLGLSLKISKNRQRQPRKITSNMSKSVPRAMKGVKEIESITIALRSEQVVQT
jgi:hypothetical protein